MCVSGDIPFQEEGSVITGALTKYVVLNNEAITNAGIRITIKSIQRENTIITVNAG